MELEKGMGDGVHTRPDFPDASEYKIAGAQFYPLSLTFPKHQCSYLS